MKLRFLSLFFCSIILGGLVANAVEPNMMKNVDKKEMEKWVNAQFKKMTKEERVAQMMVIGVSPRVPGEKLDSLKRIVKDYNLGGLIFHEMSRKDYTCPYTVAYDD